MSRQNGYRRGIRLIWIKRTAYLIPSISSACRSLLAGLEIPIEDLRAVPEQHAFLLPQPAQHGLEILDPVRHARDIGMHRDRHDLRAISALPVHALEVVHGARE